jgi:type I restriction enzyme S subunit
MVKSYREYKEISLPWLKSIPSHWDTRRAKSIFISINERSQNGKEELLSVSSKFGVIKRKSATVTMFKAESYENYKLCWENDLVINSLWAWQTGLGFSPYHGIISTAYSVFRLKNTDNNYKYLHYLLRSTGYQWELQVRSKGIWRSRYQLSDNEFLDSPMILPPRPEQDQIVRYLDRKVSMIDKYINAKKKQIELLKERKQAIINQAITKGLDPKTPMKDSGIEWLGKIPAHWEVVSLRRIAVKVKTGGTPSGVSDDFFSDNGMSWYTPGDFTDNIFLSKSTRKLSNIGQKELISFPPNTVFIIGIGGTLGKVAVSKHTASCNQQINAIICKPLYNELFLLYYLRSIKNSLFNMAKHTTLPILNQDETKNIPVFLLNINEQTKIVEHLYTIDQYYNKLIEESENQIVFINEYRIRLISDVVTGRVNVQNVRVPAYNIKRETEPNAIFKEENIDEAD